MMTIDKTAPDCKCGSDDITRINMYVTKQTAHLAKLVELNGFIVSEAAVNLHLSTLKQIATDLRSIPDISSGAKECLENVVSTYQNVLSHVDYYAENEFNNHNPKYH